MSIRVYLTWFNRIRQQRPNERIPSAVLAYVRGLIPTGVPVLRVEDSEFGAVEVLRQLDGWGWQYVLRQKGNISHVSLA
jgi:hypothetical protein